MKTLCDYLNDAKKVTGSDYATAKRIEISRQALSEARKTGRISAETAVRLAEILGIEAIQIIAASEVQKAPEKAPFWAKFSAAFFCAFALILCAGSNEVSALESNTYKKKSGEPEYILCVINALQNLACFYRKFFAKIAIKNEGFCAVC